MPISPRPMEGFQIIEGRGKPSFNKLITVPSNRLHLRCDNSSNRCFLKTFISNPENKNELEFQSHEGRIDATLVKAIKRLLNSGNENNFYVQHHYSLILIVNHMGTMVT